MQDGLRKRGSWLAGFLGGVGWLAGFPAHAVSLYDGSLGTLPGQQGWSYAAVGVAGQVVSNGSVNLDTTLGNATQAGYFQILPDVDSAAGFALAFTAQILAESHTGSANRAGFSVLLLDNAHRGVELGFWQDQVWAQSLDGSNNFVKAEAAGFATTAMADYQLSLQAGGYALSANGSPLLSGPLRDYSLAGVTVLGVPIYATNNFLFLGDDTSSAKASVNIASVSAVPLPAGWALMLGPLAAGLTGARRRARAAGIPADEG